MDKKPTLGQTIKALPAGQFENLGKVAPTGSLEARKLGNGAVRLYWRYTLKGKTAREPIGIYDSSAPPKSVEPTSKGYSIEAAMRRAQDMARLHDANLADGGYAGLVAAEEEAKRLAARAKEEAAKNTLRALLETYCNHLQALGRDAHRNARSIFTLHVFNAWPKESAQPANTLTPEQIADMKRKVQEAGKRRTAVKLRSYMHAAYAAAIASTTDADLPVALKVFRVTSNPVALTAVGKKGKTSDKNPLSGEELRTYWLAIKDTTGVKGAALKLHLLTGGQRIEQLVRLKTDDTKGDSVKLFDGKGRPGKPPREHLVPLIPAAATALRARGDTGEFVLSTDGETHIAGTTLSGWAAEAAVDIPAFSAKRVRSGVETLLASMGVSKDTRGRLQSHGIGGVQDEHYDAWEYMPEKREALMKLYQFLQRKAGARVVQIRAA